jgi:hypothetical protein
MRTILVKLRSHMRTLSVDLGSQLGQDLINTKCQTLAANSSLATFSRRASRFILDAQTRSAHHVPR